MNELEQIFKTITIKPGEHLVIKAKYLNQYDRHVQEWSKSFPDGTMLFFTDELDDITKIDEEDMRRLGWARIEQGGGDRG